MTFRPIAPAVCLALVVSLFGVAPAAAQFVEIIDPVVNDAGDGFGCAFADVDLDGDLDLYIVNNGANTLARNDGGTFVDVTVAAGVEDPSNGKGVSFADFFLADGFGALDLYVANAQARNTFCVNNLLDIGVGLFACFDSTDVGVVLDPADGRGAACVDIDTDGLLDVFVARNGANHVLQNQGATYSEVTVPGLDGAGNSFGAAWADFDNDGDQDLYLTNNATANNLLRNDGFTGFVDVAVGGPLADTGNGRGAAWGDYDNDGDLDLYLANFSNQANKLFRNDGMESFVDVTAAPLDAPGNGFSCAWADYDNDADLDLYLTNNGANFLFRNDGGGTFVDATSGNLGDTAFTRGTTWGDIDDDGDLDLFVTSFGTDRLFRNDLSSTNRWLHLDLVATVPHPVARQASRGGSFNPSAVGARVRIVAGGVTQIREVNAGSGLYSQNSLTVEFGLGSSTVVDSLIIEWPLGTEVYTEVATNRIVQVVEGEAGAFSNVTTGPLGDSIASNGVAWGDYDDDGDQDLYVTNNGANQLLRNDAGTFVDVSAAPVGDTDPGRGAAWGDYDNDGNLDLFLANFGDPNKLFQNVGGGSFVDATGGGPLGGTGGQAVAWADYDMDGDLDLYVAKFNEANQLFRNDGGGSFSDVTTASLGDGGASVACAWADYDDDGDPDLYLSNSSNEANKLFRNDGGGDFVDVASGGVLADAQSGSGVAWGDYDNDGDLDLYLANQNQANKLFRNEGGGMFSDATIVGLLDDTSLGRSVAWGDYDNDGDLDLFLANFSRPDRLFRNDGPDDFVDATGPGPLGDGENASGAAWADYDEDGDPDLYLAKGNGGNKLFRNDASGTNHWVQVELTGTVSNRAGIGARVLLKSGAGESTQVREVSGGSGFLSQDALVASFGLGSSTTADSLIVEWPSGIRQVVFPGAFLGLPVDQKISVMEPAPAATMLCPLGSTVFVSEGSVSVPIVLSGLTDSVKALGFDMVYDPDVLVFFDDPPGSFISQFDTWNADALNDSTIRWGAFDATGVVPADPDTILTVVFDIDPAAMGSTLVRIENAVDDFEAAPPCTAVINFLTEQAVVCPVASDITMPFPDEDTLSIPITIADITQGMDAFNLDLEFDPNRIECLDVVASGFTSTWTFTGGCAPGLATIDATSPTLETPTNPDTLAYVLVKVLPDTTGMTAPTQFKTNTFGGDLGPMLFNAQPCSVTVNFIQEGTGDVNANLELSPGDGLCAFLCAVEFGVPASCIVGSGLERFAADINCNGICTPQDGFDIFQRYLCDSLPNPCQNECGPGLEPRSVTVAGVRLGEAMIARGDVGRVSVEVRGSGTLNAFLMELSPAEGAEVLGFERSAASSDWTGLRGGSHESGVARLGGFDVDGLDLSLEWVSVGEIVVRVGQDAPASIALEVVETWDDVALTRVEPGHISVQGVVQPSVFELAKPRPNPFQTAVAIRYSIPSGHAGPVALEVYDVAGRRTRTLVNEVRTVGRHEVLWHGDDDEGRRVAPGVYFYRIRAGEFVQSERVILKR